MSKKNNNSVQIPKKLLVPVASALKDQLVKLESTKKKVSESDPFKNTDRASDNAALDTEAEEQFGHAMADAMRSHLNRRIIQTRKALVRIKIGKYGICENCGNMIDTDRLMISPESTLCVTCQNKKTKKTLA
jgi:RNA polymerase-binding transcription factor DksA